MPIGSSLPQVSDSGSCDRAQGLSVSQIPEKSGLPSAVRGVGADRLGFPFALRGTPAVGYFNHWAATVADQVRAQATANATLAEPTMDVRIWSPRKILFIFYVSMIEVTELCI
jgi:hypothetical protein